jgi:protein ImuB
MTARIASIWWPHLAIERWRRTRGNSEPADAPVVLTIEGPHGLLITAVTKAAAQRGAQAGARLTDARAIDPALIAVPADPDGDRALVERLARWATRWSPLVEADGPDGLRLDMKGVAHLFGGEEALAADMKARFAAIGLTAQVAIADTAAAAWAMAHFPSPLGEGGSGRRPRKGEVESASPDLASLGHPLPRERELIDLPAAALRLSPDTLRTLERLGLKTIGALMDMPRLALARRFRGADDVVDALDRLTGRKPEPLTAAPTDRLPRALLKLEEPALNSEAGAQALERLIPLLVEQLQRRHLGARQLVLTGFRVDGSIAQASVATTIASREPKHLQRLLAEKAAVLDPEFGFDAFTLEASWAEPLGAAQESLVDEPSPERDLARLVDRLSVKLGPERVRRPVARESHLPERASGWVRAIQVPLPQAGGVRPVPRASSGQKRTTSPPPAPPAQREGGYRPQRLLDRPEAIAVIYATPEGLPRRFMWRRAVHDIVKAQGPERIAPEWWRQSATSRLRDYYRIEDSEGRRYWIYREGLAGDGRGGAPNWFIHGLFG